MSINVHAKTSIYYIGKIIIQVNYLININVIGVAVIINSKKINR